jgi:OOP family OmpA-OmpF porin
MKKIFAVAVLCTLIASPSWADDKLGFYVGLDLGVVALTNAGSFPNMNTGVFIGGYQFSQNLAIEAGTFSTYDDSPAASGSGRTTSEQKVSGVSVVGIYPVSNYFALFGKIGWNTVTTSQTYNRLTGPSSSRATTNNATYGMGVQYNINSRWALRAQYEYLGKSKLDSAAVGADTSLTSYGFLYHF